MTHEVFFPSMTCFFFFFVYPEPQDGTRNLSSLIMGERGSANEQWTKAQVQHDMLSDDKFSNEQNICIFPNIPQCF